MPSKSEAQPLPYRAHPIGKALKQTISRSIHQPRWAHDQAAAWRKRREGFTEKVTSARLWSTKRSLSRGERGDSPASLLLVFVGLLSEQLLLHTRPRRTLGGRDSDHCCPPCSHAHVVALGPVGSETPARGCLHCDPVSKSPCEEHWHEETYSPRGDGEAGIGRRLLSQKPRVRLGVSLCTWPK